MLALQRVQRSSVCCVLTFAAVRQLCISLLREPVEGNLHDEQATQTVCNCLGKSLTC